MFKRSRVAVALLLVGLVAGVVFAGLCLDHQQIFTYSDSKAGFDHAVHYTSAQGHDIPSVSLTPPQAESSYFSSSSSESSGDRFVQNYSTGAHEYYDPRCDIPNRSIRGPEWVTVSPGELERITPNKPILVPEALPPSLPPQYRKRPGQSKFAEQMRAGADEMDRRMKRQAARDRTYLIIGQITTPEQWRQLLKECGAAEIELLSQYNYWQIAQFRQYLETIPGFREHIRQLAQAIKENPKFMKDGVWGLEYEKHNTKYFKDKLGNGVCGSFLGWVAGAFSDPRDHSKFHDLVHAYEDYFSKQEAVEAVQLQAVKDHNQALADHLEEIYNPSDPSDPREPFPTIIRTNTYDDPFCISDVAKYYEGQSALIPHTKGMEPYRDRILQRAKALRAAAMDPSTPSAHTLNLNPTVLQQNPELGYVSQFEGNAAQLRLHQELVYEINSAHNKITQSPGNPFAQANEPLIQAFSSAAVVQENPQAAYHFTDACIHLNTLTDLLEMAMPGSKKIVDDGVALAGEQIKQHIVNLFEHPCETLRNDIINAGNLAANALFTGYLLTFNSQEATKLAFNRITQVKNFLLDNPVQTIALIAQMALPTPGGFAIASAKNLGITAKLATGLAKQQQIAAAIGAVAGVSNKQAKALMKAAQPALQSVQQVVKKAQQAPPKVAGAVARTLREEVIALYSTTMPPVNWRHIFCSEVRTNRQGCKITGFHSELNNLKNNNLEILSRSPANQHGIYSSVYFHKGLTKKSTMFPKDYNMKKIKQVAQEAYDHGIKNPSIQDKANGLIGISSDGIKVRFWFSRDKKSGQFFIDSFHPEAAP
jgi:hypothetical protein